MNTRLLSVLFLLFWGLGFSSCSKEENTDDQYDAGKSAGAEFRSALDAYNNSNDLIAKGTAGLNLYRSYANYKQKSGSSEWKEGFLSGATNADETKSKLLENILDNNTYGDNDYVKLAKDISELFFGN